MITLSTIKKDVETLTGLQDLCNKTRSQEYVFARYLYFTLSREFTKLSFNIIGRKLNRDHSTVVYGMQKFKQDLNYFPRYKRYYYQLKGRYQTQSKEPICAKKSYIIGILPDLPEEKINKIIELI